LTQVQTSKEDEQTMDWDDACSNGSYIENGAEYPSHWATTAQDFRQRMLATGHAKLDITYGSEERQALVLFSPAQTPRGLVVFVHGGYWLAFDESSWSHLANGAIANGWSVAIPSYPLERCEV
jgi:arylformamidase